MTKDSVPKKETQVGCWYPGVRRPRQKSPNWGPTMTKQEFKKDCDVNEIIKKFKDTGVIEHVNQLQGQFGDFTHAMDYQSSLNKLKEAQESFAALPANVRKRFQNDPSKLVDFVNEPKNRREAAALGLLSPDATKKEWQAYQSEKKASQDAKDKEIAALKEQLSKKAP